MSCPTDRRTASQPLPQRRGQQQQQQAVQQGQPQGSGELAAALSRRLMIVEGVASCGGVVCTGMKAVDQPTGSQPLHHRANCGGPSMNALRVMQAQAHHAGTMPQSAGSCSFGVAGSPPPPTSGSGSARFSVAMGSTSAHTAVAGGVRHQTAWTPLDANRIQRSYVRQDTPQGTCTPVMGMGCPSPPVATPSFSGPNSPRVGTPVPGNVQAEHMVPRFGRMSAPATASCSPDVSPTKRGVPPRRMEEGIPITMVTPRGRDESSRGWRSSRDPVELQQQEMLSARFPRREASHLTNSPVGELADLKQDIAVYMDLAKLEKQRRHEALAAQQTAEARAEAAEAKLAQLEEKLATVDRPAAAGADAEADKLRLEAVNSSLEQEVTALRRKLRHTAEEVVGKFGDTIQRNSAELEVYRTQIKEEVATRNRMDAEMTIIRQEKRRMAEELKQLQAERAAEQAERAAEQQKLQQFEQEIQQMNRERIAILESQRNSEQDLADARRANKAMMDRHDEETRHLCSDNMELVEANRNLRRQVQELAVGNVRAGGRTPPSTPLATKSPSAATTKSFLEEAAGQQTPTASSGTSSESRLRAALARGGATSTDELGEAIASVEAMLGEARRELQSRRLRERRAAYEALHSAETSGEEDMLARALAEARRTEVDNEEIQKAEAILEQLRSLSQEERAARDAAKRRAKNKEQAFLLVKRDAADALRSLLESVDAEQAAAEATPGPRWPDWKDHAGRTLLRCSTELSSKNAEDMLKLLLEAQAPNLPRTTSGRGITASEAAALKSPERSPALHSQVSWTSGTVAIVMEESPEAPQLPRLGRVSERTPEQKATGPAPETTPEAPTPVPDVFEASCREVKEPIKDEPELRAKAFRAVVKDDTQALAEVIVDRVPCSVWSLWENKAGKDLLTLSEERGSSAAYSLLAKALGLLKERKRETFEEREAVWVLLNGEVQPRRATVLEDTPEEVDEVLLEYWEGDAPACRIDRSLVLKACN